MSRLVFFDSNGNEVFDDGDARITLQKVETNADHIRSMTNAELADWYFDKFFPCVPYCSMLQDGCPEHDDCKICLLDWLKQESEAGE